MDLLWVFGSPSICQQRAAFHGFFSFLFFASLSFSFSIHLSFPTRVVVQLVQLGNQTPGRSPEERDRKKKKSKLYRWSLGLFFERNSGRLQVIMILIMMLSLWVFLLGFIFASTHDDLGCQGQARSLSTSTILPLVCLVWKTPEIT